MKKYPGLFFCLIAILLQAGCGCGLAAPAPEPEPPAAVGALTVSAGKPPAAEADMDGLLDLLESAARQQPCTAGSSLRMAALAGETLRWLAENPVPPGMAARAALRWGADKSLSERQRAGRAFHFLGEAAAWMDGKAVRGLLEDAGCPRPENCPCAEEFLRLTEELYRALTPEIFKKTGEIMNISSQNHCGPERSVL